MPRSRADDIQLTVGLEEGDVTSAAERLQSSVEQIFNSTAGKKISLAFASLQNEMAKTYKDSSDVLAKMREMEKPLPTSQYTELERRLEVIKGQFNEVTQAKAKMEADPNVKTSGSGMDEGYARLLEKLDKVVAKQAEVRGEMEQLKAEGKAFLPNPKTSTEEYQELKDTLAEINNQMSLDIRQAEEFDEVSPPNWLWERFKEILGEVGIAAGNALRMVAQVGVVKPLELAADAAKKLASSLKQVASATIKGGINGLAKSILGIGRSSDSANASVKKGIKLFIKYAFGVRSFFFLYRKVRKAVSEGFGDMAHVSAPLNNQISQLATSMLYLRNAVTSAFAPIASFVIPILTTLINTLAAAANAVGQFMAALLGQTSFVKAKKVYKDYAASLDKSSGQQQKNASKTQKKVDKLRKTIAGFDDVNILESKDDDKDSSPGGGGGGGGGSGVPWENPANMFETTEIEGKFKELADKIKGFFKNEDWEGLGAFIASGINSAFTAIDKVLTDTKVQEKISKITNAITRTLNSLVTNIDWPLIGKTFGDGINLIVKTINQLYTGFNWYNLGSAIASGLNSLIDTVDWGAIGNLFANRFNALIGLGLGAVVTFDWAKFGKSLGKAINGFFLKVNWTQLAMTLSRLVNGLFTGLQNVIDTVDWTKIATKLSKALSKFIRDVDWANVGKTLSNLVITALDFISTAIDTFDWDAVGEAVGTFLTNIKWGTIFLKVVQVAIKLLVGLSSVIISLLTTAFSTIFAGIDKIAEENGGSIIQGLLNGMINALKSIGSWIKDNVFTPIINSVKKAFGIASPAKTMNEPGKDIVQGLLKGITNGLKSIGSWVKTNIFNKIKTAIMSAFGISGTVAKNIVTHGKAIIQGMYKGITDVVKSIGSWIKTNVFDKAKNALITAFNIAGGVAKNILSVGKSITTAIKNGIEAKWSDLKTKVAGLPKRVKDAFDGAKNMASNLAHMGKQIISKMREGIEARWDGKDSLKSKITGLPGRIKSAFEKNIGSKFTELGKSIVTGIKKGITDNWITNWFKDKVGTLKTAGQEKLKSGSPSKVFRDEIGKTIPWGIAVGIDDASAMALDSMDKLTSGIIDTATQAITLPPIVGGQVIPYSVGKANVDGTNNTLNQVLDMLQYNKDNAVSMEDLQVLLTDLFRRFMNIQFYLEDEQVARHANSGNLKLNRRYNTTI